MTCSRPVPVDGPLGSVHCGNCQSDIPLAHDYWVGRISRACDSMRGVKVGQSVGSMILGDISGETSLARFSPYCDECKTDFAPGWEENGIQPEKATVTLRYSFRMRCGSICTRFL